MLPWLLRLQSIISCTHMKGTTLRFCVAYIVVLTENCQLTWSTYCRAAALRGLMPLSHPATKASFALVVLTCNQADKNHAQFWASCNTDERIVPS